MAFRILLLFLFISEIIAAQNKNQKNTIDSLNLVIRKLENQLDSCRNSVTYKMLNLAEQEPVHKKEEVYTEQELRMLLLGEIKEKSPEKYAQALELITQVDSFTRFCDSLKAEMIDRTGGVDVNKRPIGYKNKEIVQKMLIEEQKGVILKNKIKTLRTYFLTVAEKHQIPSNGINSDIDENSTEPWEKRVFSYLPMAAAFSLLQSIKNQALKDEIYLLKQLKLKS